MGHSQTKVYTEGDRMIPRVMIRAMVALVLMTLAIATFARVTDRPLVATPPASPVKAEARLVLSADAASGAAEVHGEDGALIAAFGPNEGGFIAGITRVLHRERTKHRVAVDGPVILQAYEYGRMGLIDPATGWRADLMGFGADNAEAFARLLAMTQEGGNT